MENRGPFKSLRPFILIKITLNPYKRLHCMIYKDYIKYEKDLSRNNHKGKAYEKE